MVWDCEGGKSLGPDRYNFSFIKTFWHILKFDFVKALKDFHSNEVISKGRNASFISIIRKRDNPQGLGKF